MNKVRGSLGVAALKGRVYAVGGGQPDSQEATAEVLDPELNVWMTIKTMANKRFTTACAVVDNAVRPGLPFACQNDNLHGLGS